MLIKSNNYIFICEKRKFKKYKSYLYICKREN